MNLENLIQQMTIKEKTGQLIQVTPNYFGEEGAITGPIYHHDVKDVAQFAGSVLGTKNQKQVKKIQTDYLEQSRLKIPLLFMADIIHGYENIYPIPLALSCSWNTQLIYDLSKMAAQEARFHGIDVTFSPMLDHVNDPRWGRVMESNGEDKLLNSLLGEAYISGYQNEEFGILSCPKHFVGYGASEAGRDYNRTNINKHDLFNKHLVPFSYNMKNIQILMSSFNTIDDVPVSANDEILIDILRRKMKYEGVVISDWGSIGELISHKIAENNKQAAKIAISNKTDIDMMSFVYYEVIEELINEDIVDIELIDESVRRVLKLKQDLGLFEDPFRFVDRPEQDMIETMLLKSANESIVLLKNNGVLPLDSHKQVEISGPLAKSNDIMGNWSYQGNRENLESLYDHLNSNERIKENSDTVLYVLGETDNESGEARSKTDINIPQVDIDNIKKYKKEGRKVISIVHAGRPLVLSEIEDLSDAILYVWHLGLKSSQSISETIYGINNPSGKITMSFPRNIGQIPVYYDQLNTGRPQTSESNEQSYVSQYIDAPNDPLYAFGYGLNYSNIQITDATVNGNVISEEDSVVINVSLVNASKIDGSEVVQIYMNDLFSKVSRPNKELIGFEKIYLPAETKKDIEFTIKLNQLKYKNSDLEETIENGKIELFIGFNSNDTKKLAVDCSVQ